MLPALAVTVLASADPFLGDGHHGSVRVTARRGFSPSVPLSTSAAAGQTSLEVPSDAGFASGDLVLLHRTTSDTAVDDRDAGTFDLGPTDLGRWELARLGAPTATGFALTAPLDLAYPAPGSQAVLVHELTSLTVEDAGVIVPARAWDGSAGGLVAIFVQGDVALGGAIDVGAAGFRGGAPVVDNAGNDPSTFGCTNPDEPSPRGAFKGESFYRQRFGPTASGLGRAFSGGGGGVCHNAGGGAGSHVGPGGKGGASWDADGSRDVGGRGGVRLLVPADRLTFGGGGGAGEAHHGSTNNGGSRGGGALFLRARNVAGAGALRADGATSPDVGDASGGAGAGGSIVVAVSGALSCGVASAQGGSGGINACFCEGTSGGGGGGRVLLRGDAVSCPASVEAGLGGHFMSGTAMEFRLAEPGFATRGAHAGTSVVFDGGLRPVELPDAGSGTDAGDGPSSVAPPAPFGVGCACSQLDGLAPLVLVAAASALRRPRPTGK